uniref:Uncharacterized protein n=1 Tax=viral metagenome TaxID=1070528 RepID=A0A6M3X8D3_9ZZZZ
MEPHNTNLYTLGKGILYIADYDTGCGALTYRDLGNCPRLEVEVTEETLDHFSSRSGTRTKDKIVILETGYNVNFDLDEKSVKNLQLFIRGALTTGPTLCANTVLNKEYVLKFKSDNPVGYNETWIFYRVKISPGGPLNLIGDEWMTMSFSGEGLNDSCHSTCPYFWVGMTTTSSTSTTTSSSSSTSTA